MTIRTRITLVSGLAMTTVVVLLSLSAYTAEARELRGRVDIDLRERAQSITAVLLGSGETDTFFEVPFGTQVAYAQVIYSDGRGVPLADGTPSLPIGPDQLAVAEGTASRFYSTIEVGGIEFRVLTIPLSPGLALQVARPIEQVEFNLLRLRGVAVLLIVAGVGVAIILGRIVARSALRPVEKLTEAAELVASTRDLAHRIDVAGEVELVRLAESMNSMVAALDGALKSQHRLVADASHELQTPLTILRTNVEFLKLASELPPEKRHKILDDMTGELDGLTRLVTNLVDLARNSVPPEDRRPVAVDETVKDLIAWARRAFPQVTFDSQVQPHTVLADADQVTRMVRNLLDNAARWTSPGSKVVVRLLDGQLSVRDHGPGIAPDDLPHVFERFYRSTSARSQPGSGLGLAIVAKAAQDHGWLLDVENAEDGGAIFRVMMSGDIGASTVDLSQLEGVAR